MMQKKKKKITPAALKRGRKLIAHDMPKGWELSLKQRNKRTHPIRALESNRRCSSSFLGREAGEGADGRSLSPGRRRRRRVRAVSSHALGSAAATPGWGSHRHPRRHRVLPLSWAAARPRWRASFAASAAAANGSPCYGARFRRDAPSEILSRLGAETFTPGEIQREATVPGCAGGMGGARGLATCWGGICLPWKGSDTRSGRVEGLSPECSQET